MVLRLTSDFDATLAERVRGQTADLAVQVVSAAAHEPLEVGLEAQLERARGLTQQHGAQVVVWFARDARALTVFVSEPERGRLFARRIDAGEGDLALSAQQEAAALVVRTALRALSEGGEIGVREQEMVAATEPAPVEEPAPEEPAVVEPPAEEPPSATLRLAVGARGAYDGASQRGAYGITARVGVDWQALRVELRGSVGLMRPLEVPRADLRLARYAVSLHGGWVALKRPRFDVTASLGAGVAAYRSEVRALEPSFHAEAPNAWLTTLAADLAFQHYPAWARGFLGWAAVVGVEGYPSAPRFGYQGEGGRFVGEARLWHAQPVLSLEAVLRLR